MSHIFFFLHGSFIKKHQITVIKLSIQILTGLMQFLFKGVFRISYFTGQVLCTTKHWPILGV